MPVEALSSFLTHRKIKRVIALLLFLATLVLLRHIATLVVFYLIFAHGFGYLTQKLAGVTPLSEKVWLGVILALLLGGIGVGLYAGVHRSIPAVSRLIEEAKQQTKNYKETNLYKTLEAAHLDPKKYAKQIKSFGKGVIHGLRTTGRTLMHLLIGLILGVLFVIEREEVEKLQNSVEPDSFLGYLIAFFGYAAEAIVLTVKVQVIVAGVNALVTLPVILYLRLPHIVALMLMVFVFGLVPVVGNFISGIVLGVMSYLQKGWVGVAIFFGTTVVLHKAESYYLNPRLVAKHVKLPSLVLIASLIVWEHLIGFAGIFVSFPALYIGLRIRDQFRHERAVELGLAVDDELPSAAVDAAVDDEPPSAAAADAPADDSVDEGEGDDEQRGADDGEADERDR